MKPVRRPARTISLTMRDGTKRTFDDVDVIFEPDHILIYDDNVEQRFLRADLKHWAWEPERQSRAQRAGGSPK